MHLIWVSIISVPPHQCTAEQCAVIILGHPQFCYLNWHAFVPTSRLELLLIPPPETRTILMTTINVCRRCVLPFLNPFDLFHTPICPCSANIQHYQNINLNLLNPECEKKYPQIDELTSWPVSLVADDEKKNRNRLARAINVERLPRHFHRAYAHSVQHRDCIDAPPTRIRFCMYNFAGSSGNRIFVRCVAVGQSVQREFISVSIFIVDRINFWLDKNGYKNKSPSRIALLLLLWIFSRCIRTELGALYSYNPIVSNKLTSPTMHRRDFRSGVERINAYPCWVRVRKNFEFDSNRFLWFR